MVEQNCLVFDFNSTSGFLPPGRYSCDFDEAERLLVASSNFAGSSTRQDIWDGFGRFLAEFLNLESKYPEHCSGPLIDRVWLGGSFVSAKIDPNNIDVTVFLNASVRSELKGLPGSGILNRPRKTWLRTHRVSPLFVTYHPVASLFKPATLEDHEREYFLDRGRWDDWWQRCRIEEDSGPSIESAAAKRGYLEVIL